MQACLEACLGIPKIFTVSSWYIENGVLNLDNIPECEEMLIDPACRLSIKKITLTKPFKSKKLSLLGCKNLTELPDVFNNSHNLKELNLRGCDKLEITDSLMDKISALEERDCNVMYSEHLKDHFKALLNSISALL